ncbi:MAG: KGK family protein [Kastovskya adunca ATA6-11-RM4]|jgi:hypothetical protein|nr:KGK family protein [Kastovskya adunca ATA6-11-RM4]
MENNFESLDGDNDVISVCQDGRIFIDNCTFKKIELLKNLTGVIRNYENNYSGNRGQWAEKKLDWFSEGIDCEVIRADGKGWQTGKVRITLEFAPDEPESPLDDIRRKISEENQQSDS